MAFHASARHITVNATCSCIRVKPFKLKGIPAPITAVDNLSTKLGIALPLPPCPVHAKIKAFMPPAQPATVALGLARPQPRLSSASASWAMTSSRPCVAGAAVSQDGGNVAIPVSSQRNATTKLKTSSKLSMPTTVSAAPAHAPVASEMAFAPQALSALGTEGAPGAHITSSKKKAKSQRSKRPPKRGREDLESAQPAAKRLKSDVGAIPQIAYNAGWPSASTTTPITFERRKVGPEAPRPDANRKKVKGTIPDPSTEVLTIEDCDICGTSIPCKDAQDFRNHQQLCNGPRGPAPPFEHQPRMGLPVTAMSTPNPYMQYYHHPTATPNYYNTWAPPTMPSHYSPRVNNHPTSSHTTSTHSYSQPVPAQAHPAYYGAAPHASASTNMPPSRSRSWSSSSYGAAASAPESRGVTRTLTGGGGYQHPQFSPNPRQR